MLHIKQIKKFYGSFEVLNIGEMKLSPGTYWLKGANGSGKSTLMNVLAGLLPFKGDVTINEKYSIIKDPVRYRALVNHAPAEPVYPPFVSGNDLVAFYTTVKQGSKNQIAEIKEVLRIDGFLSNPTGSYSSGMRKKLSLLLSFIGKPQWILLDEPFTTIDTETQTGIRSLIKSRNGVGFMITSHHNISLTEIPFTKIFTVENKTLEQHS